MQTICYIDDSDTNISLITKAFSKNYGVLALTESASAVDQLVTTKPDLILLDVNMPQIDGYELCRTIRATPTLESTPVVFLTCRSDLEDRLTGYEAGGDAYVSKPFELSELSYIVQAQLSRYQQMRNVEDKAKSASDMAYMMMKNNSEIGEVVHYARALSNVVNETDVIEKTFHALMRFGLNSTLMMRLNSGEVVVRSDGKPFTAIEAELLDLARSNERIVHVGNKYIFSGHQCAFLINNMPIEDEALTGRLRDHLAIMIESCEACVELLNLRQQAVSHQQAVTENARSSVINEYFKVLDAFELFREKVEERFDKLTDTIEESFIFLGLTDDQEKQLMSFIEEARRDHDLYKDYSSNLQEAMNRIAVTMDQLNSTDGEEFRH